MPHESQKSSVWLVVTVAIGTTVWELDTIPSNLFEALVLSNLLKWLCWSISSECSRENLCRSQWFCVSLVILVLCSMNYSHTRLPRLTAPCQLRESFGFSFSSCSWYKSLETQGRMKQCKLTSFVCHLSGITVHHFLMPSVLKTIVSYSLLFLFCFVFK